MTPQEIQQLKALIVATGMYYGQDIPDTVLALYVQDLSDLSFSEVAQAYGEARRDPKVTRCPLPAAIRDKIQPATTDENEAIEAVSRLIQAIACCGWNNPERAKDQIGELGWRIVELEGGWTRVCESLTEEKMGTTRAQWRQMALTQMKRARAGIGNTAPALPKPKSSAPGLERLGSMREILHIQTEVLDSGGNNG